MIARCDLSDWVEVKPLRTFFSWAIADFLYEDIICCYSCFKKLIIDGGSENKKVVAELAQKYKVKKIVVFVYHTQANGMIEHGYKPIVYAFLKMLDGRSTNWVQNLPVVLWADQLTVCMSTGLTPYYIS